MKTETVTSVVEQLTLSHMNIDIDMTKLLTIDYPEAHIELAVALTQRYFNNFISSLVDAGDAGKQEYIARALDHSKWMAINRLTTELPELIDRTTLYMLTEAEETGWYRSDWFGYDDITGLLSSIYDAQETGTGIHSEWRFIVEQLVPACEKFGVAPGDIMSASCQTKKLRRIVPSAREVLSRLKEGAITTDEAEESIRWLVGLVKDPKVTAISLEERTNEFRGKAVNRKDPIPGSKYFMPGNKVWFVIEVDQATDERMVEQALKNRVEFSLEELDLLVNNIRGMLKTTKL